MGSEGNACLHSDNPDTSQSQEGHYWNSKLLLGNSLHINLPPVLFLIIFAALKCWASTELIPKPEEIQFLRY